MALRPLQSTATTQLKANQSVLVPPKKVDITVKYPDGQPVDLKAMRQQIAVEEERKREEEMSGLDEFKRHAIGKFRTEIALGEGRNWQEEERERREELKRLELFKRHAIEKRGIEVKLKMLFEEVVEKAAREDPAFQESLGLAKGKSDNVGVDLLDTIANLVERCAFPLLIHLCATHVQLRVKTLRCGR